MMNDMWGHGAENFYQKNWKSVTQNLKQTRIKLVNQAGTFFSSVIKKVLRMGNYIVTFIFSFFLDDLPLGWRPAMTEHSSILPVVFALLLHFFFYFVVFALLLRSFFYFLFALFLCIKGCFSN
jgi:hypothetical protein